MFWLLLQIITIVTPLMAGVYWLAGNSYVKMALCFCFAITLIAVYLLMDDVKDDLIIQRARFGEKIDTIIIYDDYIE